MLSVLIPANNEEGYIGPCLEALLVSEDPGLPVEIIVSANACHDATVAEAERHGDRFAARGWGLTVLDSAEPGKPGALDRADAAARGAIRVYLDADVIVSPPLLRQLAQILDRADPAYASGRLQVMRAKSWITRAYARIWVRLPFMTHGVPGAGVFAVNAKGRARWESFPRIISDDTFVRLSFTPKERHGVDAPYRWPMVEGFSNLVRVRRRQNAGVAEIATEYPDLLQNDDKHPASLGRLMRLAFGDPAGFAVYCIVTLVVLLRREEAWTRGR